MASNPCRIVILISGSGSNLRAIIDAVANGKIQAEIASVISNQPDVLGLDRARAAGIPATVINHKDYSSRELFDTQLQATIDAFTPDLVVLAGFMRILSEGFVAHYLGRLINIHPSRLPKYRGLHTHQRVLDAGDKYHGASTHFVTAELDGGPVILQSRLAVLPEHDADSLAADLLKQEHRIYPLTVEWFCSGRLNLQSGQVFFDGTPLQSPLQLEEI